MPFAFEKIAPRPQVTDNRLDFVRRKSRIDRDRQIVQPEFGFEVAGTDVNVRRLTAFV
jgi:hypothetical protein